MALAKVFSINVPALTGAVVKTAKGQGARFDRSAEGLVEAAQVCDTLLGPSGLLEHVIVTPRELGCTTHPTHAELFDFERMFAWSQEHLPHGRVLDNTEAAALLVCLSSASPGTREGVLFAAMKPLSVGTSPEAPQRILQSVCSAAHGEWWFYGVDTDYERRRYSLDHRFLFQVRDAHPDELAMLMRARTPTQATASTTKLSPWTPGIRETKIPGLFCGHEAVQNVLAAYGVKPFPFLELHRTGLMGWYGWLVNQKLGRMIIPSDVAYFLRKKGVGAMTHLWGEQFFERHLQTVIDRGRMAVVLSYAQRRHHGQHFVVVAGYERYRGALYWLVSDGQFGSAEYALPRGNTLYSTKDFLDSFPGYLLGVPVGAFVTEVL